MKNKTFIAGFLVISFLLLSACSLLSMNDLPEGELMKTVYSPDESYKINSFLVSGGATVDFSVRCEVIEISSGKKRNIYWEYHCDSASIIWIDNTTVKINEKELNVITDSYDWRK